MIHIGKAGLNQRTLLKSCQSLVCIAFAISLLITHSLWSRIGRTLPACPIFLSEFSLKPSLYIALSVLLLASLLASLFPKASKYSIGASLAAWLLFVTLDLNCLQPSFYFFAIALALFWFEEFGWISASQVFFVLRYTIAATYFFGGLHKINPVYHDTIYLWMIQSFANESSNGTFQWILVKAGHLSPYFELLAGLGLLFAKTRKVAAVMAIVMHLFILACLGPWGHDFNYIIFPWNIVLIAFNAVFFLEQPPMASQWHFLKKPIVSLLLFTQWILPVGHHWAWLDSYLAHDLYSGKSYFGFIVVPNETTQKVPFGIQQRFEPYNDTKSYINLTKWSLNELSVPIYPEKRVLKYYKHWFETYSKEPKEVELIIYSQKKDETIR